MKQLLISLMFANAALLIFGAAQHAGIAVGPFREPPILPAMIVESICALALIWGAASVTVSARSGWPAALTGNLITVAGVARGIVALHFGRGPRTASNDLYHKIMLALAFASLIVLFLPQGRAAVKSAPLP